FTPTAACRTWIFAKTSFHLTMQRCKAGAALRPPKRRGQSISPGGVIAPPYVLPTSSLKSLPPLLRSHTWHFASNSVSSRVDYLSNHDLCRTKGRVVERCACCPLLASQARGAPEGLIPGRPSKPRRLAGVEPELQIVGREHRLVAGTFSRRDAGGDDGDLGFGVRVVEEGDRVAFAAAAIDDAVRGRNVDVVRPAHQAVADVDDEGAGQGRGFDPLLCPRA